MSKVKVEKVEKGIEKGLTGSALGAFITGKKSNTIISAMVGAAVGASIKAFQEAVSVKAPVMYEEDGALYVVHPDGSIEFVKQKETIRKTRKVPQNFSLD